MNADQTDNPEPDFFDESGFDKRYIHFMWQAAEIRKYLKSGDPMQLELLLRDAGTPPLDKTTLENITTLLSRMFPKYYPSPGVAVDLKSPHSSYVTIRRCHTPPNENPENIFHPVL